MLLLSANEKSSDCLNFLLRPPTLELTGVHALPHPTIATTALYTLFTTELMRR